MHKGWEYNGGGVGTRLAKRRIGSELEIVMARLIGTAATFLKRFHLTTRRVSFVERFLCLQPLCTLVVLI
jgi:hypothetical protein